MTQQKHTPGPWGAAPALEDAPSAMVIRSGSFDIATVWGGYLVAEADVRLIAAAPDLYEALIEIRDMLWSRPDISDRLRPLMGFAEEATNQKAAKAIAKAEGREI